MKKIVVMISASLLGAMAAEDVNPKEGFERAMMRYRSDACDAARKQAKANYAIVDIDAGCRCEKTDDRLWLCDVGFTYREKSSPED